jgi:16S rRNA (guanine(1405)-N(7))-methyltransferase
VQNPNMTNKSGSNSGALVQPAEEIAATVVAGAKYRHVSRELVGRLVLSESGRSGDAEAIVKNVRNRVHQVAGAFLQGTPKYDKWLEMLRQGHAENPERMKRECLEVMRHHSSTQERLNSLDIFYATIFNSLPKVSSVIDIACGLNPLSIPWMPLQPGATYHAYDIYDDMIDFLNKSFALTGVRGTAEVRDVVGSIPSQPADVAFVLKALPCLQQIDLAAPGRILDTLQAGHIVVSYPLRSLGGKAKGMLATYSDQFENLIRGRNWSVNALKFPSELVYIINKPQGAAA